MHRYSEVVGGGGIQASFSIRHRYQKYLFLYLELLESLYTKLGAQLMYRVIMRALTHKNTIKGILN